MPAIGAVALQVVQGDGGGDHRVHDAFGNFALRALGVSPQDGGVRHQVAHIAQEHQRAAMQAHFAAPGSLTAGSRVWRGVDAVRVQAAREGLATLGDLLGQRAWMMPSQLL
jgi:hypothetical protein